MTAPGPSTLLYRGGWLAAAASAPPPEAPDAELASALAGWSEHSIGGYVVRCDETWTVTRARTGEAEVLILGLVMDVVAPQRGQQAVADGLAAALAASRERFYDALDDLSGAHVLFVREGARLRVLQDATGMETVSYARTGAPLLASHPTLIADLRGYRLSAAAQRWLANTRLMAGGFYFPGLQTLYDEVWLLTPNTEIDPDDRSVHRFWPRRRLERRPVEDIAERCEPWLRDQFPALVARGPTTVSLTGGIDTRLTLAASREAAGDLLYWTYAVWGKGSHLKDIDVAARLAGRLGLRHEVYRIPRGEPVPPEAARAWARIHGGEQGGGALQLGLAARYPAGHLHVRSNVLETVRGFYFKKKRHRVDVVHPYLLSSAFHNGRVEEYRVAFREFCDVTDFTWRSKRNVHWADLFYWEHRMGSWHGRVVRNLKVSHNTHVIFNCRRVLGAMLGRPLEDRAGNVVVYALIRRLWPEVLDEELFTGGRFVRVP